MAGRILQASIIMLTAFMLNAAVFPAAAIADPRDCPQNHLPPVDDDPLTNDARLVLPPSLIERIENCEYQGDWRQLVRPLPADHFSRKSPGEGLDPSVLHNSRRLKSDHPDTGSVLPLTYAAEACPAGHCSAAAAN